MAEQQTFADSVAQYFPFLNRLVRSLMRGDQMAEDIVQQTFVKALTNAHQFRFDSTLKTWLASIAVNEVRQAYRCLWHKRAVPLITEIPELERSHCPEFPHNTYEAEERALLVRD